MVGITLNPSNRDRVLVDDAPLFKKVGSKEQGVRLSSLTMNELAALDRLKEANLITVKKGIAKRRNKKQ
jgi:hypothetical protein